MALSGATVEDKKTMKFSCAVKDSGAKLAVSASQSSGTPVDANGLVVSIDGSCAISSTSVTASSSDNNYSPVQKLYQPSITVTEEYNCIRGKQVVPTASVALNYVGKTDDAMTGILSGANTANAESVTLSHKQDGKTFEGSLKLLFNMGTDRPHPNYYDSSCSTALCHGSLEVNTVDGGSTTTASYFSSFDATKSFAQKYEFGACAPDSR